MIAYRHRLWPMPEFRGYYEVFDDFVTTWKRNACICGDILPYTSVFTSSGSFGGIGKNEQEQNFERLY